MEERLSTESFSWQLVKIHFFIKTLLYENKPDLPQFLADSWD